MISKARPPAGTAEVYLMDLYDDPTLTQRIHKTGASERLEVLGVGANEIQRIEGLEE